MAVPATLIAVKNATPEDAVFPALDCIDSCRFRVFDAYLLYDSWALLSIRPGGEAAPIPYLDTIVTVHGIGSVENRLVSAFLFFVHTEFTI